MTHGCAFFYFIIISNQREKIVGIYRNICLQKKSNSMSDKYVSSYVHSTLLFPFLLFITAIPFSVIIRLLLSSPSSHRYPPIRVFPPPLTVTLPYVSSPSSHRYPPIRVFPPPLTVTLPYVSSPSSHRYPPIRLFPLLSPLPSHTCLPPPLTVTLPYVSSPSSHRYPPIRVFSLLSPLPSHTCLPPPLTVTLPYVSSPSSQGPNVKLTHTQQLKFHSCVDHTFKTAVMESTSAKQR